MLRKIIFVFITAFILFGCEQPTNEITKEETTINNIPIIWKGSLPYAPSNPSVGWAYYDTTQKTAFIWNGNRWEILAKDGNNGTNGTNGINGINGQDGIGILWKGEFPSDPLNPQLNWAYYNIIDGNSYIYNGNTWDLLAKSGRDGATGILLWIGTLTTAPSDPQAGWAYHNSTDGTSYIFDGYTWQILVRDGVVWKGVLGTAPANPQINWAYYNTTTSKSYIWDGSSWQIMAESGNTNITVPITWKGSQIAAPFSPEIGWMYYNSVQGKSYIWDGTAWNIVAQDGRDGQDGTGGSTVPEGFLITWKGGLASAPSNPQKGWAYYNTTTSKSYIWDGNSWQIMAESGNSTITVPITWKGTLTAAPVSPEIGWMYYNSVFGKSYVWDGTSWNIMAQDGKDGTYPEGFLITWKGGLTSAPSSPQKGWAYYNTTQKKSFIWDGSTWQILAQDGADGSGSGGNNGGSGTQGPYIYVLCYTDVENYLQAMQTTFSIANFGKISVGNSVKTKTFYIGLYNGSGMGTISLTGNPPIQISGPDADCFFATQPSSTTVSGTYITDSSITFAPKSPGVKTATITIHNNSRDKPEYSFTVTGTALSAPIPDFRFKLSVNGTAYIEYPHESQHFTEVNFGSSPENGAVNASIIIENIGNNSLDSVLDLTGNPSIQITGPNADCFIIEQPSLRKINTGSSVVASIKFAPVSTGIKNATITIHNNSLSVPNFSFTVFGTGTVAVPMMCINLEVKGITYTEYPFMFNQTQSGGYTFSSVNFGDLPLSETVIASINIQNNAENSSGAFFNLTDIPPIKISGPDVSSFSIIQPQVTSLAGGSNTTARIQFNPVSVGYKTATITILNNSPQKPNFSFTITGNGITSPVPYWPKVYDGNSGNDRITCSLTDSLGNLYFIGNGRNMTSSSSGYDWWIKKFDPSGNEIISNWDKKINMGTSSSDRPQYAVIDSADNIIISDGSDNKTVKFSSDGTEQWRLTTGGTLYVDNANSVFVVKSSSITKYNSAGTQQWTKAYGGTLKINTANNIIVYSGSFLRYLTSAGTESWTKTVTGFTVNDAVFDSNGNTYIAGYGENLVNAASDRDVWIKKYNSAGTEITTGWDKKIDWGYNTAEYARQIFMYDSYIFVTGYGYNIYSASSAADGWIKQFTTDGQELSTWNKVLNNDGEVNLLRIDSTGNMYFNSGSSYDAVIRKYSINNVLLTTIRYNGRFQWTNPQTGYKGTSSNYVDYTILMFDSSGNLYVSGKSDYSNIFSPDSNYDWIIRKFNSMGVEQ